MQGRGLGRVARRPRKQTPRYRRALLDNQRSSARRRERLGRFRIRAQDVLDIRVPGPSGRPRSDARIAGDSHKKASSIQFAWRPKGTSRMRPKRRPHPGGAVGGARDNGAAIRSRARSAVVRDSRNSSAPRASLFVAETPWRQPKRGYASAISTDRRTAPGRWRRIRIWFPDPKPPCRFRPEPIKWLTLKSSCRHSKDRGGPPIMLL